MFLSGFAVAALTLLFAAVFASWSLRRQLLVQIEHNLAAEAELTARLLSHQASETPPELYDQEADAIGRTIRSRLTFIGHDGRVLGDSMASGEALAHLE